MNSLTIEEVSAFLKNYLSSKDIDEQKLHDYVLTKLKLAKDFINTKN